MKLASPLMRNRTRHRAVFRYAAVSLFYFLSAVVFLKLGVTVISSTDDRIVLYGRFPVSSSPSFSADDDTSVDHPALSADKTDLRVSNSINNYSIVRLTTVASPLSRQNPVNGSGYTVPPSIIRDPLVVHVTWFYQPQTEFRFHEAICLLAVQRYVRPRKILFWYDAASTPPTGPWWQFARQSVAHLLPVPIDRPTSVFNRTLRVPEHQSDVVRLSVLEDYGGLYVDLDLIIVRPIDDLLRRIAAVTEAQAAAGSPTSSSVVTMGAETPEMLGSGFILSPRPGAEFIRLWRRAYANGFVDSDWNRHSVYVPMELARRHPGLVQIEWFSINRPNWYERSWLYGHGRLWDWSSNYAVHLWYRDRPRDDVDYDPVTIRGLNTTVGEVFRHIYYGHPRLLPPETADH